MADWVSEFITQTCLKADAVEASGRPLTKPEVDIVTAANFLRKIAPYAVPPSPPTKASA